MTQLHLCKSSSIQVHSLILCSTSHSSTMRQDQHCLQQEPSASAPCFGSSFPSLSSQFAIHFSIPFPKSSWHCQVHARTFCCRGLWLRFHRQIGGPANPFAWHRHCKRGKSCHQVCALALGEKEVPIWGKDEFCRLDSVYIAPVSLLMQLQSSNAPLHRVMAKDHSLLCRGM